jgi:hypothetical protein
MLRHFFERPASIAPILFYRAVCIVTSSSGIDPSSFAIGSQNFTSSREPIATCKYRLNPRTETRFLQPSTTFAGLSVPRDEAASQARIARTAEGVL